MASSAWLSMAGTINRADKKYARMTDGPVDAAAKPGNRKKPELNMAPVAMTYTSDSCSSFLSRAKAPPPLDSP